MNLNLFPIAHLLRPLELIQPEIKKRKLITTIYSFDMALCQKSNKLN